MSSAAQNSESVAADFRQCAEDAAAGSVHHAALSGQYLDLAEHFAGMAEEVNERNLSQMLQQFAEIIRDRSAAIRHHETTSFREELCERSAQAAATSFHHSQLSSRYLSVSRQMSDLAERVTPGNMAELIRLIARYSTPDVESPETTTAAGTEFRLPGTETRGALPTSLATNSYQRGDRPQSPAKRDGPAAAAQQTTQVFARTDTLHEQPALPATDLPDGNAPMLRPGAGSRRPGVKPAGKTQSVRHLAQRFRSAAIVTAQRVRLKAKRRTPQQREAEAVSLLKDWRIVSLTIVVHAIAIIVLATIVLQIPEDSVLPPIEAAFADEVSEVEEAPPIDLPPEEDAGAQMEQETAEPVEQDEEPPPEEMASDDLPPEEPPAEMPPVEPAEPEMQEPLVAASEIPASAAEAMPAIDYSNLSNRTAAGRAALLKKYGGSQASESAVRQALLWIANQQMQDGSWNFTILNGSPNPGKVDNRIGATAYALLPFLAAGQTHQHRDSPFQKNIEAGLNFLLRNGVRAPAGYDLRGIHLRGEKVMADERDAYYAQGAATLVLCEAYQMTKDRRLKLPAEAAVQFIVSSQDPNGGGWEYVPQSGDGTASVTILQLMALMSAKKAGLSVPENTLNGIDHFFDSVRIDDTGRYAYRVESMQFKYSVTAMALLGRMYRGWGREHPELAAGVELLDRKGPYENLYTSYFMTQVMRNWGGEEWDRWNDRLRDDLVSQQEKAPGPTLGSWKPRDNAEYSTYGGRLLTTVLATLMLEAYYRYEPLLPDPGISAVRADTE